MNLLNKRGALMIAALATVLAGCQPNRMVFVDNQNYGLTIGTDENKIPIFNLGYEGTSGVYMPMAVEEEDNNGYTKVVMKETTENGVTTKEPVLYRADGESSTKDLYSVMASFGTTYEASGQGQAGVQSKGGISKYFATGIAAQTLAKEGGAQLVSTEAAPTGYSKEKIKELIYVQDFQNHLADYYHDASLNSSDQQNIEIILKSHGWDDFIAFYDDSGLGKEKVKQVDSQIANLNIANPQYTPYVK